jgi:hypothetical protein
MSASRRDPDAILRRLEWTVIRRLDGLLHGDYRTLFRGVGVDLADLREYQYHDDVRHIDWNVTARLQTPYVREYHEDRDVTAWLLVDLSPSADFGSGTVRKREVAIEFASVLARLLSRHGNRVGALLYGDALDTVIPAKIGRPHVLHIVHRMLARAAREESAPTDIGAFLHAAAQIIRRRSLVFVVSDFISVTEWDKALARLARRNEVVAIRIADPTGARAARSRARRDAGRGNRGAALRRHERPRLQGALRGGGRATRGSAYARHSVMPRSMRWSFPRRATWSTHSYGSPSCASAAASWRAAASFPGTWPRTREISLAPGVMAAAGSAPAGRGLHLRASAKDDGGPRVSPASQLRLATTPGASFAASPAAFPHRDRGDDRRDRASRGRRDAADASPSGRLAIDVSSSMRATDVKPSRSQRRKPRRASSSTSSRAAHASASWRLPRRPRPVQHPTHDRDAARAALERLTPQAGTALGSGIVVALGSLFPGQGITVDAVQNAAAARKAPPREPKPLEGGEDAGKTAAAGSQGSAAIILLTDGQANRSVRAGCRRPPRAQDEPARIPSPPGPTRHRVAADLSGERTRTQNFA